MLGEVKMGIFSFLNRNDDQDFFGPLRWAILSLKKEPKDIHLTVKINYAETTGQELINDDPENYLTTTYQIKTVKIRKTTFTDTPLYIVKKSAEIQPLLDPLEDFYSYLYTAAHNISDDCIYDIGQNAYTLVKDMDSYLVNPDQTTLKKVEKARDNLRNACKCINTRDKVFSALVGGVLAAIVVILCPAAAVPVAAKAALTTGAAILGALAGNSLLNYLSKPIQQYAPLEEAINSLLPDNKSNHSTSFSSNKIRHSKMDYAARLTLSHAQLADTKDSDEDNTGTRSFRRLSPFGCCTK